MSVVMKSSCYLLSLSVKQRNSGELVLIKQVKPATGLNSCCIIFFTTSVDAFTTHNHAVEDRKGDDAAIQLFASQSPNVDL